jgi:two-component system chemotaxis response regulator CheB
MEVQIVKNIVVIGASAGGISAVSKLARTLNENLDAAIFVVIHISFNSKPEVVCNYIQQQTPLKCKIAVNGEAIQNQTIYFCPEDYQMMVVKNKIVILKSAMVNNFRPSIDVLFRSAAASYHSSVAGVILTGIVDDGVSGMASIKKCGGICIVEEPSEAEFPGLPLLVLEHVEVDYTALIEEIAYILIDHYSSYTTDTPFIVPEIVGMEANLTLEMNTMLENVNKLGAVSPFTCPVCGGSLIKIEDNRLVRYRCLAGHSYSESSLQEQQKIRLENSLWISIRMMEERKNFLRLVAENDPYTEKFKNYIAELKNMMLDLGTIK